MEMRIVLDTNIFLNVKNRGEPYFSPSKQILDAVDEGKLQAIISVITIAELCSGYYSAGDERGKQELITHLLSTESYKVVDLDIKLSDLAGRIRAETGLRLPDAIIVASGIESGATYIVTHDEEFRKGKKYLTPITSLDLIKKLRGIDSDFNTNN